MWWWCPNQTKTRKNDSIFFFHLIYCYTFVWIYEASRVQNESNENNRKKEQLKSHTFMSVRSSVLYFMNNETKFVWHISLPIFANTNPLVNHTNAHAHIHTQVGFPSSLLSQFHFYRHRQKQNWNEWQNNTLKPQKMIIIIMLIRWKRVPCCFISCICSVCRSLHTCHTCSAAGITNKKQQQISHRNHLFYSNNRIESNYKSFLIFDFISILFPSSNRPSCCFSFFTIGQRARLLTQMNQFYRNRILSICGFVNFFAWISFCSTHHRIF